MSSERSPKYLTERVLRAFIEAADRVDQRPLFNLPNMMPRPRHGVTSPPPTTTYIGALPGAPRPRNETARRSSRPQQNSVSSGAAIPSLRAVLPQRAEATIAGTPRPQNFGPRGSSAQDM